MGFLHAKPTVCCRELRSCNEQQRWRRSRMHSPVCEFLVEQEERLLLQNPVNILILDEKIKCFYT